MQELWLLVSVVTLIEAQKYSLQIYAILATGLQNLGRAN